MASDAAAHAPRLADPPDAASTLSTPAHSTPAPAIKPGSTSPPDSTLTSLSTLSQPATPSTHLLATHSPTYFSPPPPPPQLYATPPSHTLTTHSPHVSQSPNTPHSHPFQFPPPPPHFPYAAPPHPYFPPHAHAPPPHPALYQVAASPHAHWPPSSPQPAFAPPPPPPSYYWPSPPHAPTAAPSRPHPTALHHPHPHSHPHPHPHHHHHPHLQPAPRTPSHDHRSATPPAPPSPHALRHPAPRPSHAADPSNPASYYDRDRSRAASYTSYTPSSPYISSSNSSSVPTGPSSLIGPTSISTSNPSTTPNTPSPNDRPTNSSRRASRRRPPMSSSTANLDHSSNTPTSAAARADHPDRHAKPSTRPPAAPDATPTDRDAAALSLDLDRAARKAVASADPVTLALLLTSWANTLAEARSHHSISATQFELVLHGSQALDIVSSHVVLAHRERDSPVRKALSAVFAIVLYGDDQLHARLIDLVAEMYPHQPDDDHNDQNKTQDLPLTERAVVVTRVLAFLKYIALNLRAYSDVLPDAPDVRGEVVVSNSTAATSSTSAAPASTAAAVPVEDDAGPAGPDPTKAVERALDVWRRGAARLQGEMALILVLQTARDALPNTLCVRADDPAPASATPDVSAFYVAAGHVIHKHLEADLSARIDRLNAVYWPHVLVGADAAVFRVARDRCTLWLNQFESARSDIEHRLDDAGIGFGPAAAVPRNRFPVLLAAGAGVAALVSSHQRSFVWAAHAARLLVSMATAVKCLETVADGALVPRAELREKFFGGLETAFAAVADVGGWSFASLHDKVLGSLEMSVGESGAGNSDVTSASTTTTTAAFTTSTATSGRGANGTEKKDEGGPTRMRSLRFEEPPKTPGENGDGENGAMASRRKPRHARMKSSPDALLHLNARFDEYSDGEDEMDRNVDREIEFNDDEESADGVGVGGEKNGEAKMGMKVSWKREVVDDENGRMEGETNAKGDEDENDVVTNEQESSGSLGQKDDVEEDLRKDEEVVVDGRNENDEEDDDEDDRDIIVHEDVQQSPAKKMTHPSHVRSMSVDGIPF